MRFLLDGFKRVARSHKRSAAAPAPATLSRLQTFGSNPGALQAWYHVPEGLTKAPALVVVLHGCGQNAAGYDQAAGWSKAAEDFGFAVLYPEQIHTNNPKLCFNWFNLGDIRRGQGEVHSIWQMVETMTTEHGINRDRIYITGLSAGGAMANAALCAYPETFAGGAIIAGLPYAVATSVPAAFDRMRGHGIPNEECLQERLAEASSHIGPWPTISVWHGTIDGTVAQANASAIITQWSGVHDVPLNPSSVKTVDGHKRLAWRDRFGRDAIELYLIERMDHGTPLDVASGYGQIAPYMLDAGISSTLHTARSWGLTPAFRRRLKGIGYVRTTRPAQVTGDLSPTGRKTFKW
ncbi:PHB depolymerase family esterase (plasmid) [Rhizobium sp. CB3171]|uniref:extracellular catalytic domain type 1 short-chain-length polyhydroxyalkanoate depolymerase n=1 Tax=Rhizobium sp. CB3171 TaxID=3039157 RepID=UPI0024B0C8A1|nr:PHB depolymerase family esterase [Rhizobium sp. CB3171]WFU06822.1 PHB depolymerase family esterase [Rhizobium sp. CB3171]